LFVEGEAVPQTRLNLRYCRQLRHQVIVAACYGANDRNLRRGISQFATTATSTTTTLCGYRGIRLKRLRLFIRRAIR
jgi:hypothetical protein